MPMTITQLWVTLIWKLLPELFVQFCLLQQSATIKCSKGTNPRELSYPRQEVLLVNTSSCNWERKCDFLCLALCKTCLERQALDFTSNLKAQHLDCPFRGSTKYKKKECIGWSLLKNISWLLKSRYCSIISLEQAPKIFCEHNRKIVSK